MAVGDLATRVVEPEIMDDPGLDQTRHWAALRALARVNAVACSSRIVWQPIFQLARRLDRSALRVLDVATGAGDLPLELCKRAARRGMSLEALGVDISERAIEFARRRAEGSGANVRFERLDVHRDELPAGYDVATCSLFLHHLSDRDAKQLLAKMSRCAEHLVVVSDLRRCRLGLWTALAATRLLTRCDVVHEDGCASVRAAFTDEEASVLASNAGLPSATIQRRFPFRFVLVADVRA